MEKVKRGYSLSYEKSFDGTAEKCGLQISDRVVKTQKSNANHGIVPKHVNTIQKDKSSIEEVRYAKENAYIKNGMLILRAVCDRCGISGSEVCLKERKFGNGYIEIKAKFPPIMAGVSPKIAIVGENNGAQTSVDIAQIMGKAGKISCNLFAGFTDDWGAHRYNFLLGPSNDWPHLYPTVENETISDGWHILGYEQTETDAIFYVDGTEYSRVDIDHPIFAAFGKEGELTFSLSLGLPSVEAPDESTVLPCEMQIEYIKFYEK